MKQLMIVIVFPILKISSVTFISIYLLRLSISLMNHSIAISDILGIIKRNSLDNEIGSLRKLYQRTLKVLISHITLSHFLRHDLTYEPLASLGLTK